MDYMNTQSYSTWCCIAAFAWKHRVWNMDGGDGYFSLSSPQHSPRMLSCAIYSKEKNGYLYFCCFLIWWWKWVIMAVLLSESLFSCISCTCWFHFPSKNSVQLTSCLKINLKAFPLNVFLVHINSTNRFKNSASGPQ